MVTHGTNTAGVLAARANNGFGVVGVAFGATFTAIKPGNHDPDYAELAMNELDRFDIANFSVGPDLPDCQSAPSRHALFIQGDSRTQSTTAAADWERSEFRGRKRAAVAQRQRQSLDLHLDPLRQCDRISCRTSVPCRPPIRARRCWSWLRPRTSDIGTAGTLLRTSPRPTLPPNRL